MMKKHMKAVSPLIAAVLLIVFTIAVGAVVLNWMTQYTKGTTEKAGTDTTSTIECAKQILDIQEVKVVSDASNNVDNVTVFLQNLGTAEAQISVLSIYDDDGDTCINDTVNTNLPAGSLKILEIRDCASGEPVNDTSFTVRVSSTCGATDTFDYTAQ